ncbi:hypothetical protein OJAV_G00174790 [Oryzias javanicus]|uniref:Uncharacterized protein n=1 Tax=Oryzias javanicus TaxID=123683 RepID=A0A3S2P158_ORYJA|nr:hypothetical protein OJAV_G00174790 [Oryzias javanicus]
MRRIKKAGSAVCVAAALFLFLLSCLVQTAEGLRLRKTERRAAQPEPGPRAYTGAQEGQIIFGEISEKVTDKSKKTSNASADEVAYQADFPGWSKVTVEDPASKDKWNQMAASLHCFGDHMKFRSLGPGASQFEVEQANKQSLPLTMWLPYAESGRRLQAATALDGASTITSVSKKGSNLSVKPLP